MATITIHHGGAYNTLQLLSAAFAQGTLASAGSGSATLTVAGFMGGPDDLVVAFTGTDIAIASQLFTAGNIDGFELSLGALSLATIQYSGTLAPWDDLNVPLALFDGNPAPEQQEVLDAFEIALYHDATTFNGSDDADGIYTSLFFPTTVNAGAGDDTINGSNLAEILNGGADDDLIYASGGNDDISTGSGNDTVVAGTGFDTVSDFSVAEDIIDLRPYSIGSIGNLLAHLDTNLQGDAVIEFSPGDTLTLTGVDAGDLTAANFIFSDEGLPYNGDGDANTFNGTPDDEQISGNGGNDTLRGAEGQDTIRGGDDDDQLFGEDGNDDIYGGAGNDLLEGGNNGDRLVGGSGNDTIRGGAGSDFQQNTVDYWDEQNGGGNAVSVNLATGQATDTYGGTDTLEDIGEATGTMGNDTMIGGYQYTGFRGFGGNDTYQDVGDEAEVWVYYGNDADRGGTGTIVVNLSDQQIVDAGGVTGLTLDAGQARDGFGDIDTLINIHRIRGTDGNDWILGSDGWDHFQMQAGDDTIDGGGGGDLVDYRADQDEGADDRGVIVNLSGSAVTDIAVEGVIGVHTVQSGQAMDGFGDTDTIINVSGVQGTQFGDYIVGTDGSDDPEADQDNYLSGLRGNDTLLGGSGKDELVGGQGDDLLDGGSGRDIITYSNDDSPQGAIINLSSVGIGPIGINAVLVAAQTALDGFGDTDTLVSIEDAHGTRLADYIVGSDGDNELRGDNGDDTIYGGDGNDYIRGDEGGAEAGNDSLYGEDGDDSFKGGAGADTVDGGSGRDRMEYNSETTFTGDDATHGVIVNLSDSVLENVGVTGIPATDVAAHTAIDSRNHVDSLISIEDVQGTGYQDYIVGNDEDNALEGMFGDDTIHAGEGDDYLRGDDNGEEGGDDKLYGEGGNDNFKGGAGNDTIDGGEGNDRVDYFSEAVGSGDDATHGVIVNLSDETLDNVGVTGIGATDVAAHTAIDTRNYVDSLISIEQVEGTIFDDYIVGSSDRNELHGNDGNDTIYGGGGEDQIWGDGGDDLLVGGDGIPEGDHLRGGNIRGGDGDDTILGGNGIEIITGGAGNDSIDGGGGSDRIVYDRDTVPWGGQATHGVIVNLSNSTLTDITVAGIGTVATVAAHSAVDAYGDIDTLLNIERITGTDYDDYLVGDGGGNSFQARAGADTIDGGAGADDRVEYDTDTANNDGHGTHGVIVNLSGQTLTDVSVDGIATTDVQAGAAIDTNGDVDTLSGIEHIRGTLYQDYIVGDGGHNELEGMAGDDTIYGGGGDDYIRGDDGGSDAGNDKLYGEAGYDSFKGGGGNDTVDGGADEDRIEYDSETTFTGDTATHGVIVNLSENVLVGVSVDGIGETDVAAGTAIDTRDYIDTLISIERVRGTGYEDYIVGDDGRNELEGMGGDDTIYGGGGDDYIRGDDGGDDSIQNGNDKLYGGDGYDSFKGGGGNDTIDGGADEDRVEYNSETTWTGDTATHGIIANVSGEALVGVAVDGISSRDVAAGTAIDTRGYTDTLISIERIEGTGYQDIIAGGMERNEFAGLEGDDSIYGGGGNDQLDGGAGNDLIVAGDGVAQGDGWVQGSDLEGGSGDDTVIGGSGGDFIKVGSGDDTVSGNGGQDLLAMRTQADESVTLHLTGAGVGLITGSFDGESVHTAFDSMEGFRGGQAADTFVADSGSSATEQSEDFWLDDGDDETENQHRGFKVTGGNGNDSFVDNSGNPTGVLMVDYEEEQWTHEGFENDHPFGTDPGENGVFVNMTSAAIGDVASHTATDTFGATDSFTNIRSFKLSNTDDEFRAGDEGYSVRGRDGDDTIIGGAGNDNFEGNQGNDSIEGGAGNDYLGGDDGNDTLIGGGGRDNLWGGDGNDSLVAGDGVPDGDWIQGSDLDGGSGDDTLIGGSGGDFMNLSSGIDTVSGGGGEDILNSRREATEALVFTLTGQGAGTVTGQLDGDAVDTAFSGMESARGTKAADSFTANLGSTATAESSTFWLDDGDSNTSDQHSGFRVTGGAGNDSFTDSSGSAAGVLIVDYNEERWTHEDYDGGDVPLEYGVVVNTTDGEMGGLQANTGKDTYGDIDSYDGVRAFELSATNDVFYGGDAGYSVSGRDGDDSIYGGNGKDNLSGNDGDDRVEGGGGNDYVEGSNGDDQVLGGSGNDEVRGNDGNDYLDGGEGDDSLDGGNDNDVLVGGAGDDTIDGGDGGNDIVSYANEGGSGAVTVNLGTGVATDTFGNTDTLVDVEEAEGTNLADLLIGSQNGNAWFGNGFKGLGGDDTIQGGNGFDIVYYDGDDDNGGHSGVTVNLGAGTATDGFGDTDTLSDIQGAAGSKHDDHLIGNASETSANYFQGFGGNDTITGTAAFDIASYTGDDGVGGHAAIIANLDTVVHEGVAAGTVLDGFGDTDTLTDVDLVRGTEFGDTFYGNAAVTTDQYLEGGRGNDTIHGSGAHVFADYFSSNNMGAEEGLVANLQTGLVEDGFLDESGDSSIDTLVGIQNLSGSQFDDDITGSSADNRFNGNGGDDTIRGAGGADSVRGGSGNDSIDGGAGNDISSYDGTIAASSISFSSGAWHVDAGDEGNDTLTTVEFILHAGGRFALVGGGGFATAEDAVAAGLPGDVILYAEPSGTPTEIDLGGSTENLQINLPNAGDVDLTTGSGNDTIVAGSGNDTVASGNGNDSITAGAGNDFVDAGAGNDTIIAGSGNGDDVYQGGADTDTVIYSSATTGIVVDLNAIDRSGTAASGADGAGGAPDTIGELLTEAGLSSTTAVGLATGTEIGTDALLGIENVVGGSGNDQITGNSDANSLEGAGGADTLSGGGGTDILTGDSGVDQFVYASGAVTVTDFASNETVDISALTSVVDFDGLLTYVNEANTTDAVFDFGGGNTLTLQGVDWQNLDASDFVFTTQNQPPVITTNGGATLALNVAEGLLAVADINATDANAGDTLSFTLGGADAALFDINATTGVVTFKAAPNYEAPLDAGSDNVYNVTVSVGDGQGGSDDIALEVTVTDQNEGPVLADALLGTLADTTGDDSFSDLTGTLVATDPDAGATLTYQIVGETPDGSGNTTLVGSYGTLTVHSDGSYAYAANDAAIEALTGGSVADTFTVSSSDGTLSDTAVLTVNVTGVNDAATFAGDEDGTVTEAGGVANGTAGTPTATGTVTASDRDGASNSFVAVPTDTASTGGFGTFTVTAGGDWSYTLDDNNAAVQALASGAHLSDSFDVTASDGTVNSILIDIVGSNDTPTITSLSGGETGAVSVAENQTAVSTVTATDPDSSLVYSISGGADAGKFSINAASGVLTFVAAPDFEAPTDAGGNNVYDVVVRASDGTAFDEQSIAVTVTDVNEVGAVVNGNNNSNTLNGTALNDTLNGNGGNDTLNGLGGDDSLVGGTGNDSMVGGAGNDTYVVDATGDVVVEAAAAGNDTVQSSITFSLATLANVENITLTGTANINATGNAANNLLTGNTGNNSIAGAGGNDTLIGGGGNDTLDGGTGDDSLVGGAGNDVYVVDSVSDLISEAPDGGTDEVRSSITFSIASLSFIENLVLTGANIDGTGNDGNNTITGSTGNNVLNGLGGNDSLDGGTGNDTLNGGEGNDTVQGGAGTDSMSGGNGNDTYFVDSTLDVINEAGSDGIDTVSSSVNYTLSAGLENLTLTGTATTGTGSDENNTITGTANANTLNGQDGNDSLDGGGGNDTLNGGTGDDTLNGGAGNDSMVGGEGSDTYIVDATGDIITETGTGVTDIDTVQASIAFSLATRATIENLTLTGSANINGTGNVSANLVTGNTGNNSLAGAEGNDTLIGGGGNDTLDGGTGVDSLVGGAGNDVYVVDNVNDMITEAPSGGTDTVQSSVTYSLAALAFIENLTLTGTAAVAASGNGLNNTLTGNSGNNTLDGGTGNDTMIGGAGNDSYYVDNASDVVNESLNGGAGVDTVFSSVNFTLASPQSIGTVENITLTGSANINATGSGGANTLFGNSGNNALDGGAGNDTMDGGEGNDTYTVDAAGDVINDTGTVNSDADSVNASISYVLGAGLENLTLTGSSAINGTGNGLKNLIVGNSGNNSLSGGGDTDTLNGAAGNDTLDGGTGADSMIGGAGNDTYVVDDLADVVDETSNGGAGTDTVQASVSYTLASGFENLTLTGTANINGTGNGVANTITGNSGSNSLSGAGGNDSLVGNAGSDTLDGGTGNDTMVGGAGNDFYLVDATGDVVTEAANGGTDTVTFLGTTGTYTLGANVENLILGGTSAINGTGGAGNNLIIGNSAVNVLTGAAGNDTLDGGAGADSMVGGAGNDTYFVDHAGDTVNETAGSGAGTDTVNASISFSLATSARVVGTFENLSLTGTGNIDGSGNAGDNRIVGNSGNNSLSGGAGDDFVSGGAGNDTIVGGTGHDQLYGGSGSDVFSYGDADFGGAVGTLSDHSDDVFDYGAGDRFDFTGLISHDDLVLAGGQFEDVLRVVDSGGGNVVVEVNEAAALHSSADADWSAAFTVYDTSVDQLRFTLDGHDWVYDNGSGKFEIVP